MASKILGRILQKTRVPNLVDILCEKLTPTDRQSLMLEVYNQCAGKVSANDLFRQYCENRFVRPSLTNPQILLKFDQMAFDIASRNYGFSPVELSPLAPLGTCSGVASVHQNKIVSTIRNTEVLSDSTNVLAMECAKRRLALLKKDPKSSWEIGLCSSHRVVRAQALTDPRHFAHFQLFSLVSAGRDEGSFQFEWQALRRHLAYYLTLMNRQKLDFRFFDLLVKITDLTGGALEKGAESFVFTPLKKQFPDVIFQLEGERKGGRGYYQNLCFGIDVKNEKEQIFSLTDGGFTDWTQQLLNNKKERLLISGFGSELACLHFH